MRSPEPPNILAADAAEELLRFIVSFLSLGRLKEISPEVATILSDFLGSVLKLDGLTNFSSELAAILFRSLRFLSDGAAKAFAGYWGKVEMPLVEPTVPNSTP